MKALAALCVTICILYQVNGKSITDHMQGSRREVREINDPGSIDCKMSAWSQWTSCDPCTNRTHRSRGIEVFGQFKGSRCINPIGERKPCKPSTKCQMDPPPVCKSSQWWCSSGICINKNLRCNGDNDCGEPDKSDEDECDIIRTPCGKTAVFESDIAIQAGYGINILRSEPRMNPFNNRFYNGQCNRIREPSTLEYNRLPWNVGVLNYETKVEESSSKEMYEDIHSLINEISRESSTSFEIGLNFKFTPTEPSSSGSGEADAGGGGEVAGPSEGGEAQGPGEGGEAEVSGADQSTGPGLGFSASVGFDTKQSTTNIIKQLSEITTTKRNTFMRVKGRVQLATYRMRQQGLEVSSMFLDDVDALPLTYEKGQYFAFLEDYGTHFTKNGKSGGEYELVYIMNEDVRKLKKVTESTVKECLELGFKGDFQFTQAVKGGVHIKPANCDTLTKKPTDDRNTKAVIDKVLIAVRGGSPASAVAMKSQLTKDGILDYNQYVEWAKTVSALPALIHSDPEPIYNAIPLDFPDAQPRRDNLRRAVDDYVAEYSVCKCQPCQNGGSVIQVDGECKCMCLPGTEGVACQIIELVKAKSFEQLGNWGCWSSWSLCSGGRRRRTRTCDTRGVPGGICRGDTTREDYC
ncbi:complement component C9 isoform X2 [Sinocyclocheilus rhinocerous]|uniref:complement component C9 isoform X2 n=1 Tax=Sinocyclocheilus rhinocerous TaxID=307959 RepID=UPI0007BAABF0|nr:PREDICTED: complement component C9 isoform X2 [Sinocyclocheilus rhinocerous]